MDAIRNRNEGMGRGLRGRCPNCGAGPLFAGYLRIMPRCEACGEPLADYRAADGPAFFTICIVGILLVPALGWGFVVFRPGPVTLLLWVAIGSTILTLVLLRFVKGAFVGLLWARDERDRGA